MNGRPRNAALEVGSVKAKALTSAARILASQGVDDLSLRAIADDAGIGLASIYHYFANKEELILNLAVQGFEELRREIGKFATSPGSSSPMRVGHQAFFNFADTRAALFSLMYSDRLLARHEMLREAEHRAFLAYQSAVKADDRIPPEHRENAAYALWALGRGMAAISSSHPEGRLPADLREKLLAGAIFLIDRRTDEPSPNAALE